MRVESPCLRGAALGALLVAAITPAEATVPTGITGTLTGSGIIDSVSCSDPADEGPESESFRIAFTSSRSGSTVFVDGTGISTDDDDDGTLTIFFEYDLETGDIFAGSGSATGSEVDASFSVSGVVTQSAVTLDISGFDNSDLCSFQGDLVFALNSVVEGEFNPELSPSVEATAPIQLQRQIKSFTGVVFGRIADVRRGRGTGAKPVAGGLMISGGSGVNAGDGFASPLGVWASYSFADFENEFEALRYEGSRHSGLAGVDFNPSEDLILGVAAGYERASQDTLFNGGEVATDGFTVTPYLGYSFNETFSVDAAAGYSALETDQFRNAGAGTRISSDAESTRWFWGGNVNATEQIDRWYLTGSIGILWARETIDSYTESDGTLVPETTFRFGQWRVGGEIAYAFDTFEPYASATYQRDYATTEIVLTGATVQPENDLDDIFFATGLRFYGYENVSASVEYTRVMTRADYVENGLNLLVRMTF